MGQLVLRLPFPVFRAGSRRVHPPLYAGRGRKASSHAEAKGRSILPAGEAGRDASPRRRRAIVTADRERGRRWLAEDGDGVPGGREIEPGRHGQSLSCLPVRLTLDTGGQVREKTLRPLSAAGTNGRNTRFSREVRARHALEFNFRRDFELQVEQRFSTPACLVIHLGGR